MPGEWHERLGVARIAVVGDGSPVTIANQTDLPNALRECGLMAALHGQARRARQYLDESLNVAERQGARFEHVQTLRARGQVGQQYSWPEAQQDLTTVRQSLPLLGADFALDNRAVSLE